MKAGDVFYLWGYATNESGLLEQIADERRKDASASTNLARYWTGKVYGKPTAKNTKLASQDSARQNTSQAVFDTPDKRAWRPVKGLKRAS